MFQGVLATVQFPWRLEQPDTRQLPELDHRSTTVPRGVCFVVRTVVGCTGGAAAEKAMPWCALPTRKRPTKAASVRMGPKPPTSSCSSTTSRWVRRPWRSSLEVGIALAADVKSLQPLRSPEEALHDPLFLADDRDRSRRRRVGTRTASGAVYQLAASAHGSSKSTGWPGSDTAAVICEADAILVRARGWANAHR